MGVTMRVTRGRKTSNSKYTIRRSVRIHSSSNGIRITKSMYKGSTNNDPSRSASNSLAEIIMTDYDGERRKYVSIR